MLPQDFLAAVLPSQGYYCVAEFSSPAKEHVFVKNIDDMLATIQRFHGAKYDTYFAVSGFRESTNRTAANAMFIRSAFLDVEGAADSHYKSKAEVAAAVDAFLKATPLGALGVPWVVSSGGGLHFYWPFTEDIPITLWKPVAEGFKRLCKAHGLVIDFSVTADAARVLRVPGTTNWKKKYAKPRPCEIKYVGDTFKFSEFAEAVKTPLNGASLHDDIPGTPPAPTPALFKLVENSVTTFKDILSHGCKQIEHYINHAAEDGMEPLWRGILSICKPCTDAEKAARKMSALHPYTQERMKQKLREIKGPYPCAKFDTENPGVCPGCKHWGKITNPLALGRDIKTDNAPKQVTLATLATAETYTVQRPAPPRGFFYGESGGVYVEVERMDEGEKFKTKHQILPYDFFPVDILRSADEHHLHMKALRPEGAVDVTVKTNVIHSKERLLSEIMSQNIAVEFEDAHHMHKYINKCYASLSASRAATAVPHSYGWQEDNSFVYNGVIYTPTKEISLPMPGLENLYNHTKPKGTLSGWQEAFQVLITKELDDILAMATLGFAAPLMQFTELCGLVVHIASTESGTGKTLALEMAASVWGDPRQFKVNKKTSDVALENHLGLLRSLPLCVDEITSKGNKDLEWFPEFLLSMSEGRGKERMESGANRERINTTKWGTMSIMSSNSNMTGYLSASRDRTSQGELRRLLEQVLPAKMVKSIQEERTMNKRYHHYGVPGQKYVQWLVRNRSQASDITQKMIESVRKDIDGSSEERFWVAGVATALAGLIIAGSKFAGIMDFPIVRIQKSLYKLVRSMRLLVDGSTKSGKDVLDAYIEANFGSFIIMRQSSTGALTASGGPVLQPDSATARFKVSGRVEIGIRKGLKMVYIAQRRLRAHCANSNFRYEQLEPFLRSKYNLINVEKDLLADTGGPSLRVPCVQLEMPDAELQIPVGKNETP